MTTTVTEPAVISFIETLAGRTTFVIDDDSVSAFEGIVDMFLGQGVTDYDHATDRACELVVNDLGLDREHALALADAALEDTLS